MNGLWGLFLQRVLKGFGLWCWVLGLRVRAEDQCATIFKKRSVAVPQKQQR